MATQEELNNALLGNIIPPNTSLYRQLSYSDPQTSAKNQKDISDTLDRIKTQGAGGYMLTPSELITPLKGIYDASKNTIQQQGFNQFKNIINPTQGLFNISDMSDINNYIDTYYQNQRNSPEFKNNLPGNQITNQQNSILSYIKGGNTINQPNQQNINQIQPQNLVRNPLGNINLPQQNSILDLQRSINGLNNDRVGALESQLSNIGSFNPQSNTFNTNARDQYSGQLQNVINAYLGNAFTGNEGWAEALSKKGNRKALSNVANILSSQLDTASKIGQQDIENQNLYGYKGLADLRSNATDVAKLGLSQDQQQIANQLGLFNLGNTLGQQQFANQVDLAKTGALIRNQDLQNEVQQNQLNQSNQLLGLRNKLLNTYNGVGYNPANLTRDQQISISKDPVFLSLYKTAGANGLTGQSQYDSALAEYQKNQQRLDFENLSKQMSILNPSATNTEKPTLFEANLTYNPEGKLVLSDNSDNAIKAKLTQEQLNQIQKNTSSNNKSNTVTVDSLNRKVQ